MGGGDRVGRGAGAAGRGDVNRYGTGLSLEGDDEDKVDVSRS